MNQYRRGRCMSNASDITRLVEQTTVIRLASVHLKHPLGSCEITITQEPIWLSYFVCSQNTEVQTAQHPVLAAEVRLYARWQSTLTGAHSPTACFQRYVDPIGWGSPVTPMNRCFIQSSAEQTVQNEQHGVKNKVNQQTDRQTDRLQWRFTRAQKGI